MFVLASYPVHYHMALDVDSDGKNPFVRSNTIRDSFSRCVTVHGTSGVHVEDNVAVDHFGHCYFLGMTNEYRHRVAQQHLTPEIDLSMMFIYKGINTEKYLEHHKKSFISGVKSSWTTLNNWA